jgi:hypothetical protein
MEKQIEVPFSIKLIIGFLILNLIMFVIGQGGAVVSYDYVAKLGLQEARETIDPVIVVINRGIGLADVLIGVPLFILAIIGLWRLRFFGAVFSWMVLGISFYWTTVAWAKQSFYIQASIKCQPFDIGVHGVLAFVFIFSVWASWHLFRSRKLFD